MEQTIKKFIKDNALNPLTCDLGQEIVGVPLIDFMVCFVVVCRCFDFGSIHDVIITQKSGIEIAILHSTKRQTSTYVVNLVKVLDTKKTCVKWDAIVVNRRFVHTGTFTFSIDKV